MDWWFAEQTIDKNSPVVCNQKSLDPAHFVNGNGLAAAHEVSSQWSYNQQRTLLQLSDADTVSPATDKECEQLSVFLSPQ
jgi:hypothetical protein